MVAPRRCLQDWTDKVVEAKRLGTWVAILGVMAIAVATLTPVPGGMGGGGTSQICLICHARGMADFLSNVILFAPLGIGLALRRMSLGRVAVLAFLYSLAIELLQLDIIAGRDSNLGDLAANSLGGVVGWWLGHTVAWWRPREEGALWRSLGLAGAACTVLLGGLSLLVPALPMTTYFMQWTADLGGLSHYDGRVLASSLGPVELRGAERVEPDAEFRELVIEPHWNVSFIAGNPPASLAPVVSLYDGLQREVVLLGAQRTNVVYRQRLRAGELRFDEPDLRGYFMLAELSPGDTANLALRADRAEVCVAVNAHERCTHGYTVGDTWGLLMFPDRWGRTVRTSMSFTWLFAAFVPAGFVAYRKISMIIGVALALTALLAGPAAMGFAVTPAWQLGAGLSGFIAGYLTGTATRKGMAGLGAANAMHDTKSVG